MKKATKNKGRFFSKENKKSETAPDKILKAARKVFARYPYNAATTRMIAKEAGVDHPLIHYYFGSKDKLFEVVVGEIYEEFHQANIEWLDGITRMRAQEGFSIYLDRMLDYNFQKPEPLQLIILNMAQIGNVDDIPGYHYFIMHLERSRKTFEERVPFRGPPDEIKTFLYCFNNLVISYLGSMSYQAKVLGFEKNSDGYRKWVKNALYTLFLPWLQRLIFPDKHNQSEVKTKKSD